VFFVWFCFVTSGTETGTPQGPNFVRILWLDKSLDKLKPNKWLKRGRRRGRPVNLTSQTTCQVDSGPASLASRTCHLKKIDLRIVNAHRRCLRDSWFFGHFLGCSSLSAWVYHKLGNAPVLRSGTGSWVPSGWSGVCYPLNPVIRLGLRNPRKKESLKSVFLDGQELKYDRDITPHPHLLHGTNSHKAGK